MKRLHVHVAVDDLETSTRFYSQLFAADPVVSKPDYAKWMLEDPRVNFAISARATRPGIEHLGIQVEDRDELAEIYQRLESAGGPVLEEGVTTCCYAQSDKSWIEDPQGVKWETFLPMGESAAYGSDPVSIDATSGCCKPASEGEASCCTPAKRANEGSAICCS
jgi:catechol 2,3-dioxygenase-like lactoylglutathione lyase family enzyme